MSLHQFNAGKKSWKIYGNTLTSISGDDLKLVPYDDKDLILEASGNGSILFKQDGITYTMADLSNGGTSGGIQNGTDVSFNNVDISGTLLINDLTTIYNDTTFGATAINNSYGWLYLENNLNNYSRPAISFGYDSSFSAMVFDNSLNNNYFSFEYNSDYTSFSGTKQAPIKISSLILSEYNSANTSSISINESSNNIVIESNAVEMNCNLEISGNIIFDSSNYINFTTPSSAPNYSSTVTVDINTALNSNLYNLDTNFTGGRFNFAGDIEFFNNNYLILTTFGNIYKSSDFTNGSWQELDSTTTGITVIESGGDFTEYYSLYYNRGFYHFDNKLYILNQRDNSIARTGYYTSDGITWQPITDNNGDTSGIRSGIFIKVSDTNAIIYSPSFIYQGDVDYLEYNGTQWIRKTASQDQSISQYESIFSNVLYSQNFSSFFYIPLFIGGYHHIFKTTNFLDTYQTVTLPSTGLNTVSYALIFELNDKIFIIPYDINNNQSEIYYSSDGNNFYKSSGTNTPDLFNCQLTHMEYSTQLNLYFAVGVTNQANSSSNDPIIISSDGINWSPVYDYNTFNSFVSTVYGIDYVENCTHLYIKDNTDSVEIKFVLMDQISQNYQFGQRLYDIKATSYTVNLLPPESPFFEMNNNLKVSGKITVTGGLDISGNIECNSIIVNTFEYSAGKLNSNYSVPHNSNTTLPLVHHIGHSNWGSSVYTIQNTGDYKISVSVGFVSSGGDQIYQAYIGLKKGSTTIFSTSLNVSTINTEDDIQNGSLSFTTMELLNVNDTLSLEMYQLSKGSNTALVVASQTRVTIEKIIG